MRDDLDELLSVLIGEFEVGFSLVPSVHKVHGHGLVKILPNKRCDFEQQDLLFLCSFNFLKVLQEEEHVNQVRLLNTFQVFDSQSIDKVVD